MTHTITSSVVKFIRLYVTLNYAKCFLEYFILGEIAIKIAHFSKYNPC
jgi:hypothetical protein